MSNTSHTLGLPPAVRRVLDTVRRKIRAYVWLEGLAVLVALVGSAFWLGLLLDWLFEPSPSVRRAALVVVAAAATWIVYRYLIRRVNVPISDASAALLLERRFPVLSDHLLTAVTVASAPEHAANYHPGLVDQTNQDATHAVAGINISDLFNRGPLVRALIAAIMLMASIALFAALSTSAFSFWLERLALSDEPWPRRVQLEVVGFTPGSDGQRAHKLAQDDDYELLVHANTGGFEVPETVEIRYRLADGRRGRDTMIRVGDAEPGRDNSQLFRYEFKRVAGDMTFDVVGGDDRVRDLQLRVVDRPELHSIELECTYPDYLSREPRRLPVTGGMRIPEGTQIVLHAASTKPLTSARIHSSQSQQDTEVAFAAQPVEELRWEYGTLLVDDVLLVNVTDTDGVACREPYRVSLAVVPDEVPQIAVRLAGIGTAVTPEASIPLVGKVSDDYGLDRVWFEYQVADGPNGERPLTQLESGGVEFKNLGSFDLRGGDAPGEPRTLTLQPGGKLTISLKASDRYDLSDEPHAGSSQSFTLEVVTVAQLLALIERREIALRERYEAIYDKVTDTRNLLARVDFSEAAANKSDQATAESGANDGATGESAEHGEAAQTPAAAAERDLARRRLRVAGSLQNIVQSGEEIIGVAEAFDDLHDQLTNNRINNSDLKNRLRELIAQPLHRIGEVRMPKLKAQVELVEQHVEDGAGQVELDKSLVLADEILVEMQQVLNQMHELESYNEVVALLRGIISDQEEINRRTKEMQKQRLQSLLEE
jgi:hypothetical protein